MVQVGLIFSVPELRFHAHSTAAVGPVECLSNE